MGRSRRRNQAGAVYAGNPANFVVTLSAATCHAVEVMWASANVTPTRETAYIRPGQVVKVEIPANSLTATFSVATIAQLPRYVGGHVLGDR